MPLLDLKTDLKSLKYGKDRPGGGDSGQPYQKVDINTVDSGFNRFRMTKFDDGLVRGGVVGAANAAVVDTLRIGKFLTDFPKGPLFIVKQVGLQLSNPQLETKKLKTDSPTKGGGLLRNVGNFILNTANKIVNAVGPTRIYNLGINTIAQVPVGAFGIHFNRHGLLPVQDDQTKYLAVAQNNNNEENNRLTGLKNRFGLGANYDLYKGNIKLRRKERRTLSVIAATFEGGIPFANSVYNDIQNSRIADYIGGPNSVYGIGRTSILRTPERTNDKLKLDYAKNRNYNAQHIPGVKINQTWDYGLSEMTSSLLKRNGIDRFDLKPTPLQVILNSSFQTYYASILDPQNIIYKAAEQEASASQNIPRFLEASRYSKSSLSTTDFPGLRNNIPSTLLNYTASQFDISSANTIQRWKGALTASNDVELSTRTSSSYNPSNRFNLPQLTSLIDNSVTYNGGIWKGALTASKDLGKGNNAISNYGGIPTGSFSLNQNAISTYTTPAAKKYSELKAAVDKEISDPTFNVYTAGSNGRGGKTITINSKFSSISRENRIGSGKQDEINLTPIFETTTGTIGDSITVGGKPYNINDLVKFRIQSLNYNNPELGKWMIFRAYITQFSDNTEASWNEIKYAGRGDKFYVYDGFSRKISIGFQVAALSAEEMKPMYQKLNYLMGNLMGSYENNLMHGNLVKMTVGNWIDGQAGILNSISYNIPKDSPWEISLDNKDLILPHVVEVNMTFTPIGSQTKGVNKISEKEQTTSHIAQNINDNPQYIF
jgi:hypothetical protein